MTIRPPVALVRALAIGALMLGAGCAPRVRPLAGAPAPAVLPRVELAPGHRHVVFRWQLDDADLSSRGEGAARVAAPDSARLDFFVSGGLGGGAAVLVGLDLRLPSRSDDLARRLVPPAPLLWSALGRLAVTPERDTTARVVGDTLRADIGTPVVWRLTFVRDTLRRVERVANGRVAESVDRFADGHVRYRHHTGRRQLDLFITRSAEVSAFDPAIWALP